MTLAAIGPTCPPGTCCCADHYLPSLDPYPLYWQSAQPPTSHQHSYAQAPLHHLHHLPSKSTPASTAHLPLNSHARSNSPTRTLANHLLTSNHPCTPSPISSHSLFISSSHPLIPRCNRLLIHHSSFPTSLVYPLPPSPPHHQAQGSLIQSLTFFIHSLLYSFIPRLNRSLITLFLPPPPTPQVPHSSLSLLNPLSIHPPSLQGSLHPSSHCPTPHLTLPTTHNCVCHPSLTPGPHRGRARGEGADKLVVSPPAQRGELSPLPLCTLGTLGPQDAGELPQPSRAAV